MNLITIPMIPIAIPMFSRIHLALHLRMCYTVVVEGTDSARRNSFYMTPVKMFFKTNPTLLVESQIVRVHSSLLRRYG